MTSATDAPSTPGTTYARARLWTGIGGVGAFVSLAAAGLALQWPQQAFGDGAEDDLLTAAGRLALAFAAIAGLATPLDWLGGFFLPRRHGRSNQSFAHFLARWGRGVVAVVALTTLIGTVTLAAGRAAGTLGAMTAFLGTSLALVWFQATIAMLVGGLRGCPSHGLGNDVLVLRGVDPGFCGGFTGVRGRIVLPESWLRRLDRAALDILLARRRSIAQSGSRRLSILLALLWNGTGFALATMTGGAGVTSVAGLLTAALAFSLWTFVGLLVLPALSRKATLTLDARIATDDGQRDTLARAVRVLDELQDDEPERSPGVESVFHPVPAVARRLRDARRADPEALAPWHLARITLYLSYAGLSLLPRAVHCNAGRPELWVYLPTDG